MSKLFMFRIYNLSRYSSIRNFSQNVLQDRNKAVYSVLKPYLDFEEKLENLEKLEKNIKLRGLDIKLTSLITLWKHYKNVEEDLIKLEKEKVRIVEKLAEIKNTSDDDKIKSLKFSGVNVREDLKKLKIVLSQLEEQIYPLVLQLPNDIIEKGQEEVLLYSSDIPKSEAMDHLEKGKHLGLLEYISPISYFLKGNAAMFELNIINEVAKLFTDKHFIQFSNPDFTRNSVVKYLQLEDIQSLLSLQKHRTDEDIDRLHLHGGASMIPFCCFHTKSIIDVISLPIQYVTKGRHYAHSQFPGLYGVWQNSSVQIFIGTNKETVNEQLNITVNSLIEYYSKFKIPLRVIYCKPENISHSEILRISFQTYSTFYKHYFELGNLSLYGDYVSKRLRIYYSDGQENKFMHIISGTVLKIPPLLASLLEYNQDCIVNKDN